MNLPPKMNLMPVLALSMALLGCAAAKPKTENAATEKKPAVAHASATLFVMATCPHCARALNVVLPLYRELNGALDLSVQYVGSVDENGVPDLGHGQREVQSALVEMCTSAVAPNSSWVAFMECLYEGDLWMDVEKNWKSCAKKAAVSIEDVSRCLKDGAGEAELVRSIAVAANEGIEGVPTLFLDGKEFVGPMDRQMLLTHFCYYAGEESTRPAQCADVEVPKPLHAQLLSDTRCGSKCDVSREVAFIGQLFPSMEIASLDYSEPAGKALYEQIQSELGAGTIPALYLMGTMAELGPAAQPLAQYMVEFGDGFLLPMGQGFDPTAEICDNGVDDDANEMVDCADATCSASLVCRSEMQNRMDLFIMSQCPYAAMLIPAVDHVIAHLQKNGSPATVRFQFIGSEIDGTLYSMHGEGEISEDLRMACIQKLYPEKHEFMTYMMCRARDYRSDEWQKCLSAKMKESDVAACVAGPEGKELLQTSFQLSDDVERTASPSWLLNNRLEMNARTAEDIFQSYCAGNQTDPACDQPIAPLLIDSANFPAEKCE